MDPLGNIPVFLSVLKQVAPERRRLVLVREILLAYVVLLIFLFFGNYLLRLLHLQQEAVSISGGIGPFLIALRNDPFRRREACSVKRRKASRSSSRSPSR